MHRFANGLWATISRSAMIIAYFGSAAICLWSLSIAWEMGTITFALTITLPVIAQIILAIITWHATGTFFNWYTMGVALCAVCVPVIQLSSAVTDFKVTDIGLVIAKILAGITIVTLAAALAFSILLNPSSRLYYDKILSPRTAKGQEHTKNYNPENIVNAFLRAALSGDKFSETGLGINLKEYDYKHFKGDLQELTGFLSDAYKFSLQATDGYLEEIGAGFTGRWRNGVQAYSNLMDDGLNNFNAGNLKWTSRDQEPLVDPK
ncbi:hypothetical protein [Desulfoferula mesophila]|uniref:Uncharacterized protein n=1 Tax=Desulfoferula mesophila TaxID=3058419 RepID=A0AAU9EHN0_9BACT|nr:hypothetical protein FAK_36340 [Desulfoferula mesophilus]